MKRVLFLLMSMFCIVLFSNCSFDNTSKNNGVDIVNVGSFDESTAENITEIKTDEADESAIKTTSITDENTTNITTTTTTTTTKATNKLTTSITTTEANLTVVYITDTGEKYHRSSCSSLRKSKHSINISDAIAQGYTPCARCNP